MKSRASAPGKVILFGEHFVVYGVPAILCSIDRRITVTAETGGRKISIASDMGGLDLEPGVRASDVDSPLRPLYYIADRMLRENGGAGVSISVESEIPQGVGLGSSSACCIAGAAAISGLYGGSSREKILELGIAAERTIFGGTSGADCTVSACGGIIRYDANGFGRAGSRPDFDLVIANSETEHSTEQVAAGVKKFREKNRAEFSRLCNAESELVVDAWKLLKENDVRGLGEMMARNQEYLEAIGVSNERLGEMIRIGNGSSFGAKITGAGGGGCIIALADRSNRESAISRFREGGHECFSAGIDFVGLDTYN